MFLLSFSKLSWISYFVFIATNWKTADLCCRLWNNGNKGLKLPDDYFGQTKYFYSGISWHFVMKFMFSDFIPCVPTLDCISEAKYFVQLLYCRFFYWDDVSCWSGFCMCENGWVMIKFFGNLWFRSFCRTLLNLSKKRTFVKITILDWLG